MNNYIRLIFALVSLSTCCSAAVVKRMYSEETSSMSNADLDTSASGYIYRSASGHPTSYVQFTSNSAGNSHPVQVVPYYYVAKPQPFIAPSAHLVAQTQDKEELVEAEPLEEENEELNDYSAEGDKEEIKTDGDGGGGNSGFEEKGGEEHRNAQHSAHGEKEDKGYVNKHAFSKGLKGAHGHQQDEGFYKENGGKKIGHYGSAGHYQKHNEEEKGNKGEKHGAKKIHKKGQNTKGFHNVYHKDEYKKDHTFYDEADKDGFYKKHGSHGVHHASENGGHMKGGHSDAGYHNDNYGKKGHHDKGHYVTADAGFKGKKGHEAHHATYSDYANDGGKNGGAEFGYQHGGHKY